RLSTSPGLPRAGAISAPATPIKHRCYGGVAMTDSQRAGDAAGAGTAELWPLQIETNGINVIAEAERKGHPRDMFWPWFAANVSVLGLSYGSFVLGFGISFWQAVVVGIVGIIV